MHQAATEHILNGNVVDVILQEHTTIRLQYYSKSRVHMFTQLTETNLHKFRLLLCVASKQVYVNVILKEKASKFT